jgi:ElaB/YqjD/DUF883 family membrane-anchored ribosome-binding protein
MTAFDDRNKTYGTTSLGDPSKSSTTFGTKEPETTLESLQAELKSLSTTVSEYVGNSAAQAAKSTAEVASQIGSTASDVASAASDQAKTITAELERVGRANPLGAIAGALLVGVLIGMIGRGRG